MKFVVLSSLVAWVLFLMLQSSANGAKDPFSVVVAAQWPSEKVGSDLTVLATITNTSSKKITINDRQPYCDYRIDIHDEVGNVPPTDKWRKEVNWGDSSGFELSTLTPPPSPQIPLSPLLPLHTGHSPASPFPPTLTQKGGGCHLHCSDQVSLLGPQRSTSELVRVASRASYLSPSTSNSAKPS